MSRLYSLIRSLLVRDQAGQSLIEYALILALIVIVAIGSLILFGGQANQIILSSATAPGG